MLLDCTYTQCEMVCRYYSGVVMTYADDSLAKARHVQQLCRDQAIQGLAQGSGIDPADVFTEAVFAAEAAGELDAFFAELKARQTAQTATEPPERS